MSSGYDKWADLYDELYEAVFGEAYRDLTQQHLEMLGPILGASGLLLDIGAGTGRLTIPIAAQGHQVSAVEPSSGMLRILAEKARAAAVEQRIRTFGCSIQDIESCYKLPEDHDAAICVFSTLHHLQDREALLSALCRIVAGVRPGGSVLLGVHPPELFKAFEEGRSHEVFLESVGGKVKWTQYASTAGSRNGILDARSEIVLPNGTTIIDRLSMCPWTVDEVLAAARASGLAYVGKRAFIGSEEVVNLMR